MGHELSRADVIKRASDYAEKGFLCSEAVLLAISDLLAINSDLIPLIATGFAAGIGRHGAICGAISGGIIGLGLRFGRSQPAPTNNEDTKRPYWYSTELLARFKETYPTILCNELTGCDLSDPADVERYYSENKWGTTCRELITTVAGLTYDILQNNETKSKTAT
ncbi:MAG: C-GCAxxG-C-C family protein [Candidatus Hodarchaeales archaeon]